MPENAEHPSRLIHHNQIGSGTPGTRYLTIETPFGEIVLEQVLTRNDQCVPDCPDTLEVIDFPQGFTIEPMFVVTPEQGRSEMVISPYLGG